MELGRTTVTVTTPTPPNFVVSLPTAPTVFVFPVAGPRGATGQAGGAFVFRQAAPSANWVIPHNLGRMPSFVFLLDEDPTHQVFTDVTYLDLNNASVEWPTAVAGYAYA